ncbi:hypothetical protein D3C80_2123670 [compost metagenome]
MEDGPGEEVKQQEVSDQHTNGKGHVHSLHQRLALNILGEVRIGEQPEPAPAPVAYEVGDRLPQE